MSGARISRMGSPPRHTDDQAQNGPSASRTPPDRAAGQTRARRPSAAAGPSGDAARINGSTRRRTGEVGSDAGARDRRPSPLGGPLRRRTDQVEDLAAWLLAAVALFVLLLAVWGGADVYADSLDQSRIEHGQRTEVEALLLDDPPPGYREADSDGVAWRSVRFADTSGNERVTDARSPVGYPPAAQWGCGWTATVGSYRHRSRRRTRNGDRRHGRDRYHRSGRGSPHLDVVRSTAATRRPQQRGLGSRVGPGRARVERPDHRS